MHTTTGPVATRFLGRLGRLTALFPPGWALMVPLTARAVTLQDIEVVCDRIIFLHKGSILAEGTATEIKQRFHGKDLDEVFIKVARNELEALHL